MSESDDDKLTGIVRVSVRPGGETPATPNRREAFGQFGTFVKQLTQAGFDLAGAYIQGEVTKKRGDAALTLEQAAEMAAKCMQAISAANKDDQEALSLYIENLQKANGIEDEKIRRIALETVIASAPKPAEQFAMIQDYVASLCLHHGTQLGPAPAEVNSLGG